MNLKRMDTAGKSNDGEVEKRKRRKSAKLLGQQSTMFDGLTDPGLVVNVLNAGKQLVQLNSVVPATPIIDVPRDVIKSYFEEWMTMAAADNVSVRFSALQSNNSIRVLLVTNSVFLSSFVNRKSTRTTPGISL